MDQQKTVKQRHIKNRIDNNQHNDPQADGTNRHSSKKSKTAANTSSWKQSVLQGFCLSVVFFFLASYLVTDTWLWGYKGKYTNLRHWFPVRKKLDSTQATCHGSMDHAPCSFVATDQHCLSFNTSFNLCPCTTIVAKGIGLHTKGIVAVRRIGSDKEDLSGNQGRGL